MKLNYMNEVKIQIPDNCELIKDGNTYIVREKKQTPPKSWEEFCERYPVKAGESCLIASTNNIYIAKENYSDKRLCKNWCTSIEEAEAFLALMQLRQLRKAWVGDWKQPKSLTKIGVIAHNVNRDKIVVEDGNYWTTMPLSFPTEEMATEFLECFRDLCETAKILL